MIEPKISVITACYNHGKYIHEMIDSVLAQSFQNFEIIIVNDGSTDDTKEILNKIEHTKIQIIHEEHRGPSHARNVAIRHAKAPLIFNLDADDKISYDLLEKAYNVFCCNPDAGIVYSDCVYFGSRSGKVKLAEPSLKNMLYENRIISNAFFRKSDWKVVGGYSECFLYGLEDWDLWLSIIELKREIIIIQDSHSFYRKYSKMDDCRSGITKLDRNRLLYSVNLIIKRHNELYMKYPDIHKRLTQKYKEENSNNFLLNKTRDMIFFVKQNLAYQFR